MILVDDTSLPYDQRQCPRRDLRSRVNSIVAFLLFIFSTTLAILNHFPGVWYFQYPLDSPGANNSSILAGDRAYSSCLFKLEMERRQFEKSHVLYRLYVCHLFRQTTSSPQKIYAESRTLQIPSWRVS